MDNKFSSPKKKEARKEKVGEKCNIMQKAFAYLYPIYIYIYAYTYISFLLIN